MRAELEAADERSLKIRDQLGLPEHQAAAARPARSLRAGFSMLPPGEYRLLTAVMTLSDVIVYITARAMQQQIAEIERAVAQMMQEIKA